MKDSKVFFKRHKNLSLNSANNYQAFYLLCDRMLSYQNFDEPVLLGQITPMTHLILDDLEFLSETTKGLTISGALGQTRTGTPKRARILSPLCLPISPRGH